MKPCSYCGPSRGYTLPGEDWGDPIKLRYVRDSKKYDSGEDTSLLGAKESLAIVMNGWLHKPEIDKARELAADPAVTEEQAEEYLSHLEHEAGKRLGVWRAYQ